jgi:hypothetical protein
MYGVELNYGIYDKELMVVVRALKIWRPELIGLLKPFLVIIDYELLEYFGTKRLLNLR